MQNKVLSLLGIAMRGHNLVSGELQTVEAIKNGSACLVIIAGDASGNSRKLYSDKQLLSDSIRFIWHQGAVGKSHRQG